MTGYVPGAIPLVEAVKLATPEEFRLMVARSTPAPEKVTVPVGVVPEPLTVALRVTDWPSDAGFGVAAMAVLLEDLPPPELSTVRVASPVSVPPQVSAYVYVPTLVGVIAAEMPL
jgi:hypothetical protein